MTSKDTADLQRLVDGNADLRYAITSIGYGGSQMSEDIRVDEPELKDFIQPCGDSEFVFGINLDDKRFVAYHLVPDCVYHSSSNP